MGIQPLSLGIDSSDGNVGEEEPQPARSRRLRQSPSPEASARNVTQANRPLHACHLQGSARGEVGYSPAAPATRKRRLVPLVPPLVWIISLPERACLGTVAVTMLLDRTTRCLVRTPPKLTQLVPLRFAPWILTTVPIRPAVGLTEMIRGATTTFTGAGVEPLAGA